MFFFLKPGEATIRSLLAQRQPMSFSYHGVGATRAIPPPGWRVNHMRQLIGRGREQHDRAVQTLFSWQLLAVNGLQVFSATGVSPNTDVAILSRHFGLWSVDFCRVIYVLKDERENGGTIRRTGFGYGTLPGHAIRGEERFSIEYHPATAEVWYDIVSFSSLAHPLARLAAPIARATQRHFALASLKKAAQLASALPKTVKKSPPHKCPSVR